MAHKGRARYTPHKRYCIMYRHLFRYAVCGALSKREDRNTPLLKLYSGYVCSGVCYGLLHMRDLGSKGNATRLLLVRAFLSLWGIYLYFQL